MIGGLRQRFGGRARTADVALALFIATVTEILAWSSGSLGEHIAGPRWFTAGLPLLLAAPMLWRRTHPLAAWCVVAIGVALPGVLSGNSPEGLELVAALVAGPYSVAAYAPRRHAVVGLAALVAAYAVYAANDRNFRSGRSSDEWATAFFAVLAVAAWLIGSVVHSRREEAATAERAKLIDEQAQAAVTSERGRVARELHDIVSHNLSVVVLQAAGARAASEHAGFDATDTLEKIEESGREALVEMRRMLGVLRADGADAALSPQPSLRDIPMLVESVRRAGLQVDATCSTDVEVPPVIGLSAFRIVQEGLTNVLKHAGPARAEVRVRVEGDAVMVSVADDGRGPSGMPSTGHGLTGMRERVSLLGGDLHAGRRDGGGFEVCARLPLPRVAT